MKQIVTLVIILIVTAGCTAININPVNSDLNINNVCIVKNPEVVAKNFLPVVIERFEHNNVSNKVVSSPAPEDCEFILTYTAFQGIIIYPYLKHAELKLTQKGQLIGAITYHLKRALFSRWFEQLTSTKSKMDPLIDEMLATSIK